ncbi:MAG: RNB domain-containing ribonuclease [Clostridiales Family XIII bacterium]|jgi:ribonuclease R|nr:RNB domain-containing ribonuclease [Clostridiales Family XIII bacterium]
MRGRSFVPAVREVVGTFAREKYVGYVYPAAKRRGFPLFIPKGKSLKAKPGDMVMARVTKQPRGRTMAEGEVLEIISRAGEPGGDMLALVRAYGIIPEFPRAALTEARDVAGDFFEPERDSPPDDVRPLLPDVRSFSGRRDLRGETIFTIDGADAKDFDDAVSIRMLSSGHYLLGVHIADVTHYVKEDGELDKEALHRGTSVYLPDFVVPMLPEALSNGICSLNEGVDRLTLSVNMEVDALGKVLRYEIYESVIRSCARLVYEDVTSFLEQSEVSGAEASIADASGAKSGDGEHESATRAVGRSGKDASAQPDTAAVRAPIFGLVSAFSMSRPHDCIENHDIKDSLLLMRELSDILTRARDKRGSIDFGISEAEITLDAHGVPVQVAPRDRGISNRIIEEFMVLANETVATAYFGKQFPFVYRIHARPEADRILALAEFLREFDIRLSRDPGSVRPMDLARVLKSVKGKPEENMISEIVLRAMQKAAYSPDSLGHFGLALRHYCHFTSPIRRYPDLFIHRVMKEDIHSGLTAHRVQDLRGRAAKAAYKSSVSEQNAVEAEREADRMKMAEYMAQHIGENFPAVISGVTSFGVFAELENTIEGLIRMRDFDDDYYEYSEEEYLLRGRLSGRELRLGDRLTVTVKSVNIDAREIDFVPFP